MNAISDFDLGITCDGAEEKCTRQAYYAVTQHRIGHCNLTLTVVRMLCPQCTAMVLQANAFDGSFACARCGRVFHALHELIDVARLVTGATLDV